MGSSAFRKLDPYLLGPLDDGPQAAPEADSLFPGDRQLLGQAETQRRRRLLDAIEPILARVLAPDEQVLLVVPAQQKTGILHHLALGYLAPLYHQCALVLTDSRIVEILLDLRGRQPAGRVRSFPWHEMDQLQLRFGTLVFRSGKSKDGWRLSKRGDRKLLKLLVPKLTTTYLNSQGASERDGKFVLCPRCSARLPNRTHCCQSCGLMFRSPQMAAALTLAFPGAGLFYAGHPWLGLFDLAGETFILLLYGLSLLVAANGAEMNEALLFCGLLLVLTKLESWHVSQVLLARQRTQTPSQHDRWTRLALGGSVLSVVVLCVPLLGIGALALPDATIIDQDLHFTHAAWQGSRDATGSLMFAEDLSLRSEWRHEQGTIVSVFAYPLSPGTTLEQIRAEFREIEAERGAQILEDDEDVPEPLEGFRFIESLAEQGEPPQALIHYFVVNPGGDDLHQVLAVVDPSGIAATDAQVRELLGDARWLASDLPSTEAQNPTSLARISHRASADAADLTVSSGLFEEPRP